MSAREALAADRRTRYCPTNPVVAANAAAAAPVQRNRRRSNAGGLGASAGGSVGVGVLNGGRPAARRSLAKAKIPAIVPTIAGIASSRSLAGRVTAASAPTAPSTTRPMTPTRGRRTETIPRITAAMARTAPTPTRSAVLSFDPKVRIAKLFSDSGVASIADSPTAMIGEDAPPTTPAASWPIPSATAPDSNPIVAPRSGRPRSGAGPDACGSIRCRVCVMDPSSVGHPPS
jgi:hypothetical protein